MLSIIKLNEMDWVSAIELHSLLAKTQRYSNFISYHLTNNKLASEGREFVKHVLQTSGKGGGRPVTEYFISKNHAKSICAISRTEKGKEYLDYLISLDNKVQGGNLLNEDQIIMLVKLKEVFKYLSNQKEIKEIHEKEFVDNAANGGRLKKEYFVEFHDMRNAILRCSKSEIDERLRRYCAENGRVAKGRNVNDALALLDKYETLRNAVWDFLTIKGSPNALHLADLTKRMIEAENGSVWRENESDMFRQKELTMPIKKLLAT